MKIKQLVLSAMMASCVAGAAQAEDVKLGILLGFTGPAESLAPGMANGIELAMNEVSDSGQLLGGASLSAARADSTCLDAAAATAAAERLVDAEKVDVLIGALCSGATIAVLQNVAMPKGVVLYSPSATSPALTILEDNGLFFRSSPSDARQGEIISDVLSEKGIKSAALTYTNNDYGKGLAEAIEASFEKAGGKITISASHEDGKADYGAEVAALAQAGGDLLIVAGYLDQGGKGIIQSALDSGAFEDFFLPDAMVGDSLVEAIGNDLNGAIGTVPGTESTGAASYSEMAKAAGFDASSYSAEAYDAAAVVMLAMQAANSKSSADFAPKVMDVANAPGEKIFPGELAKGLKILADGGEVDYVGATAVELVGGGEASGSYREILIEGAAITTVKYR